jgi:hypothetical protein
MRKTTTVLLLSLLAGAAAAQTAGDPVRPQAPAAIGGRTGIPEAPVGHRQPTEKTLPPAARQNEATVGEGRGVEVRSGRCRASAATAAPARISRRGGDLEDVDELAVAPALQVGD